MPSMCQKIFKDSSSRPTGTREVANLYCYRLHASGKKQTLLRQTKGNHCVAITRKRLRWRKMPMSHGAPPLVNLWPAFRTAVPSKLCWADAVLATAAWL